MISVCCRFWLTTLLTERLFVARALVSIYVTQIRETLRVMVTIVAKELIAFADNRFSTKIGTAASLVHLTIQVVPRIIYPSSQNCLSNTILIWLTLWVALEDVIANTFDAASWKTFKIVVTHVKLGFVAMQTGPRIHTWIGWAAESGWNAVIIGLTECLASTTSTSRLTLLLL